MAAARALVSGPKAASFRVAGKLVECPHCENILFHQKKSSLNTAVSSLTNTEWSDHEATVLICANCSRVEWFHDRLVAEEKPQ